MFYISTFGLDPTPFAENQHFWYGQASLTHLTSTWITDKAFYHHLEGMIGCNTVNLSLSTGKDSSVHSLMMNKISMLHQNSGFIGKYLPRFDGARIHCKMLQTYILLFVIRHSFRRYRLPQRGLDFSGQPYSLQVFITKNFSF